MNTKQLNKLTMYLAVEGICDGTPTAWQSLQAFADAYTDLKLHVTNIQTFSQSQAQDTSGVAQDKQAARQAMCAAALPIANAVHAMAVKTKSNTLANAVDFSMSDLMGGRDVQSRDNCQNIYTTANTNIANLAPYGVTAAKLTALTNAIAAYNLLISKPRDTRAAGKTVTTNLQAEFDAAARVQCLYAGQQLVNVGLTETVRVEALQEDGCGCAGAGEDAGDDLLFQHAPQFPRHARGEEEAGFADVHREAASGADRVVDHLGGRGQHRLLDVVRRHCAHAAGEE